MQKADISRVTVSRQGQNGNITTARQKTEQGKGLSA